jgi:hypothetical protein
MAFEPLKSHRLLGYLDRNSEDRSHLGRVIICSKAAFPVCWAVNSAKKQSIYGQYIDRFLPVSRLSIQKNPSFSLK